MLTVTHRMQIALCLEVVKQFFRNAYPRHALEFKCSRRSICVLIIMAYRAVGFSHDERCTAHCIENILEEVLCKIRESEVLDLFVDSCTALAMLENELVTHFLNAPHQEFEPALPALFFVSIEG